MIVKATALVMALSLCFIARARAEAEAPASAAGRGEPTAESPNLAGQPRSGFVPIALPFYMPETSAAIGWSVLYYHQNASPTDPDKRPNEYALYGAVTLRKQVSVGLSAERYFHDHAYKLAAALDFSLFPDFTWGVGPDTPEQAKEAFRSRMFASSATWLFGVGRRVFVGPSWHLRLETMVDRAAGGFLERGSVPGSEGTTISAPGFAINLDTRDSVFFPHSGVYFDTKGQTAWKALGSQYDFARWVLDFRTFHQLAGEHILAFQGYAEITAGTVPFQVMPRLGGDMTLRGYYQGRYRDLTYAAAQLEYRFPVFWRLGGDLFVSVGQVAPSLGEMTLTANRLKAAAGVGIRVLADAEQHINVRLDLGISRSGDPNFYLVVKEAF